VTAEGSDDRLFGGRGELRQLSAVPLYGNEEKIRFLAVELGGSWSNDVWLDRDVTDNEWGFVGFGFEPDDGVGVRALASPSFAYTKGETVANWAPDQQVSTWGDGIDGDFDELRVLPSLLSEERLYFERESMLDTLVVGGAILHADHPPSGARVAGASALYTFDGTSPTQVEDTSGANQHLTITPAGAAHRVQGGLVLDSAVQLISAAGSPPAAVLGACDGNAAGLTLEAWVTPDNPLQTGPARLATLSWDPSSRVWMLGQSRGHGGRESEWMLRLTTADTNDNGTDNTGGGGAEQPRTGRGSGAVKPALTHVVITHDGGFVRYYIDGALFGEPHPWPGDCRVPTAPAGDARLVLGDEVTGGRPWLGAIYLFAVYNSALSPADVSQNFAAGP